MKALDESELMAIITDWDPFEIILADSGYIGHTNILAPYKDPTPDEEAFNEVLSSVRQVVECSFSRIKIFGILGSRGPFHHGSTNEEKHNRVFNVCAQITNISLQFEPLWASLNSYIY